MEIGDKKGIDNLVADHLSRIEQDESKSEKSLIDNAFPNEYLMTLDTYKTPWYADFVNSLVCGVIPPDFSHQEKRSFYPMQSYTSGKILYFSSTVRIKL